MAFPLMVGISARPANVAVLALVAVVLGTIVFLSLQLDTPLSGPFGTSPSAFQDALDEMQRTAVDS
jgi:hypothetical protein